MINILIIADDYTGALDTGVQFAGAGARTRVITDTDCDFCDARSDADVIVVDTESRHLSPDEAYAVVRKVAGAAIAAGASCIFKKTDSVLRGNVGAELTALLDASGKTVLPFIPGFPKMRRITRQGYLYVDGNLLENSVFRKDPFEPTVESFIPRIIGAESPVRTEVIPADGPDPAENGGKRIAVYDSENDGDLDRIAERLCEAGRLKIAAGCAGFAGALARCLYGENAAVPVTPRDKGLFVVCGSVNPITVRQIDVAERHGFRRIRLSPEQKLMPEYWTGPEGAKKLQEFVKSLDALPFSIVNSNDKVPGETRAYAAEHGIDLRSFSGRIPLCLGEIARRRVRNRTDLVLVILGGDTLMGVMKLCGVKAVIPIAELLPGTVLSEAETADGTFRMVTKSGGFGDADLLLRLADMLAEKRKTDADKIRIADA